MHAIAYVALSMGLVAGPQTTTNLFASSVSATNAQQNGAPADQRQAAPDKIYCTSGTISGSRIVKQECKTRSQWAKDGVDVDDLMNPEQQ